VSGFSVSPEPGETGLTGLTGVVADVIGWLGEAGVGLLTLAETVFPPVPSEVVLPLAGYLAERGRLDLVLVLVAATAGAVAGAWLLYLLGARLGRDRAVRMLSRLPLLSERDVRRAEGWFDRHGEWAVLIGRLVPGVRSLISLPAGTERMPVGRFLLLTALGSAVWNSLLVGAGYALGTQWRLVERYADWLNYAVYAALLGLLAWGVVRWWRRRSAGAGRLTGVR
jgi:membrane protein DedA with SNARE-associated domain